MAKIDDCINAIEGLKKDSDAIKGRVDSLGRRRADAEDRKKTTVTEATAKIQAANKDALMRAFKNPSTDPRIRKMIERELDDRANRGS